MRMRLICPLEISIPHSVSKETARAALSQSTSESLERTVGTAIRRLDTRIAEEEGRLTPTPPTGDPTLEFMREREARAELVKRFPDELLLRGQYQSWAVTGENDLAMRAIENAPLPMIADPSVLATGKASRAARENPSSVGLLDDLRSQRGALAAGMDTFRAELDLAPDDPIRAMAGGKAA